MVGGDNMSFYIETNNLTKQYKTKRAINNVNIHVNKGDIYGLIGRNGAGKTTLMKLLLGLIAPTSGTISLLSENNETARKKIGSLIEEPGLYKNATAYENMLRFSILYGANVDDINPILEKVGLPNETRKVREYSLGMRQRLGLAIALLNKPEVLILDEPINGLDPAGIKEFRNIILKLNKEGVTFIISSHILDELAKIVTTYGFLSDGELIEEFSATELKSKCTDFGKIATNDNTKALALIEQNFPDSKAKINNKYIEVSSTDKLAELNEMLVKNGILVNELTRNTESIEDYFIGRLGK